ncbi:MAG: FMN-binding protein [Planctomycetes bacterium]|nr:FMN-binding protein [Planctomycetota bacterium]
MKGNTYTICYAAILGTVCALLLTGVAVFTKSFQEINEAAEKNRNIFTAVSLDYNPDASSEELMDIFKKNIEEKSSADKVVDIFKEKISGKGTPDELAVSFAEELEGKKFADGIVAIFKETYSADLAKKELIETFKQNLTSLDDEYPELTLYRYHDADDKTLAVALDFGGPGLWGPIKGILALEPDLRTIKGITFYEQEETPGIGGEIVKDKFRNGFLGKKIVDADGKAGISIKTNISNPADNEIDGVTRATMTCDKVADMLNVVIEKIVK